MPTRTQSDAQQGSAAPSVSVGIGWRQPHYAELLQREASVDFLEVHSENFFASGGAALAVLERGRARLPISLHGVALSIGSAAGIDPWHLDQLSQLVERIDPVRVSDHVCFARAKYSGNMVHASDLLPLPFTGEALELLCNHVDQVQERLKRPFMVENISSYIRWQVPPSEAIWSESDFLATLSRRTGCSLLVDINNIYVNALNALGGTYNAQTDVPEALCKAWLDAMDPSCVGEIHLAGHCHVNDVHGRIVIDDHGSPVCGAVWRLYRHAVRVFGPIPTLIEWDTDIPPLDTLLDEAHFARAAMTEELAIPNAERP